MPHDHSVRIAELEEELTLIEAALINGHPDKLRDVLLHERQQTMRRIHQRRQDEHDSVIAEQRNAESSLEREQQ